MSEGSRPAPEQPTDRRRGLRLCLTIIPPILVLLSFLYVVFEPSPAEQAQPVTDKELIRLERRLKSLAPKRYYVVIDTAANRLWVKRGEQVVLEAKCSTGSGRKLECQGNTWTFETPRGEFTLGRKISNPIWRKPDWAFYEEGKPVPADDRERYEENVLGEYAMAIGDGYFIHGTLYNRMLGRNVTHGCVRLGSRDLMRLAQTVPVGTKVYIF